jgi:hypothetical protein
MELQTIYYAGRLAACASATRLFLCHRLAHRPLDDPERTFAIYMGAYAADVLRGELPGPYTDERARQYARAALIAGELLEHDLPALERTARALNVPASELRAAGGEHTPESAPARRNP